MRWPWRRDKSEDRPQPVAPPPVARREWRDLPPVQRVIEQHPLVNPPQNFAADLTTRRTTGFLSPLGHAVTDDAPGGAVEAVPVNGRSDDLAELPVARIIHPLNDRKTSTPTFTQRLVDGFEAPPALPILPVAAPASPEVERPDVRELPVIGTALSGGDSTRDSGREAYDDVPTLGAEQSSPPSPPEAVPPTPPTATPVGPPLVQRTTAETTTPPDPTRRRGGLGPPLVSPSMDIPPASLPPAVALQIAAPASPRSLPVGPTVSRIADEEDAPTLGATSAGPLAVTGA